MTRINIRALLADPQLRRRLLVPVIRATQAREGITTTREQAEAAYDKVQEEQRVTEYQAGAALSFEDEHPHHTQPGWSDPLA